MTTISELTPYAGLLPNKDTQSQPVFDGAADTWITWNYGTFVVEMNAMVSQINTVSQEVQNASDAAQGAANYQGDWTSITNVQTGQSYSYNGSTWVAKQNSTGVTPVEGAYWLKGVGTAAALDTGTSSDNVSINEYLPCDNSLGFRSARAVANNSDLDSYTENGVYSLTITLSPNKPPQLDTLSVAALLTVKRVGRGDLVQVRQTLEIVPFNRTFVRYIGLDWEEIVTDASGYGIGIGQTVQDVTASRLVNMTYTNTTGKTIVVHISMSPPNDAGTIEVNGIPLLDTQSRTGDSLIGYTFLVPNGSTYRQNTSAFNRWTELR